jgi:hypothetical protein
MPCQPLFSVLSPVVLSPVGLTGWLHLAWAASSAALEGRCSAIDGVEFFGPVGSLCLLVSRHTNKAAAATVSPPCRYPPSGCLHVKCTLARTSTRTLTHGTTSGAIISALYTQLAPYNWRRIPPDHCGRGGKCSALDRGARRGM